MEKVTRRNFVAGAAAAAAVGAMGAMTASAEEAVNANAAPSAEAGTAALKDGTYTATAKGFGGDVTVTLTVKGGKLTELTVDCPNETPERGGKAAETLQQAIVEAGGTTGVDAYASATTTSKAIFTATDDALAQAGNEAAAIPPVNMKPGVYVGEGGGFNWIEPVRVKIEVDDKKLLSVEVIQKKLNREEPLILKSAEDRMIPRMIENQSVKVDSITGATSSSAGIKAATEDALKKALNAGAADPEAIKNFYMDPVYTPDEVEKLDYDVVICGLGGAGTCAAMSVAEQMVAVGRPVSVLALETAGKYGGTAANAGEPFSINAPRFTEEFANGEPPCDYDSLYADWIEKFSIGTPCKPDMVKLLMDESGNTVDWLQFDHGFVFTRAKAGFGENKWLAKQQYIYATNKEEDIDYEALYPDYDLTKDRSTCVGYYYDHIVNDYVALGGEYKLETTVTDLIYDKAGNRVTGVKATDNVTHKQYEISAKEVIMATGGFGGNQDMQVKYLTNPEYPLNQPWNLWGMRQNRGQVIQSAIDNGFATYNMDMSPCIHFKAPAQYLTEYPVYYRDGLDNRMLEQNCWSSNDLPLLLGAATDTLQVGQDGVRHYNEDGTFAFWAGGPIWYTIYGIGYIDQLAAEGFPGEAGKYQGSSLSPYGQGGYPCAEPIPQIYEVLDTAIKRGYVYKADTLEELAKEMGVPEQAFVDQVARYRSFCEAGQDDEFGRNPETLVDKIGEVGPFYAITFNPVPYATLAAMEVDESIHVLQPDGTEVGGLFACGNDSGGVLETNLLPYAQYGGVALSWAFTSGRLAGINAVAELA